mgnify:CR=1 FL=1
MQIDHELENLFNNNESQDSDTFWKLARGSSLSFVDQSWKDHLAEMDYLRSGIGLRAMGQRDPLVEYKKEAFDLFSALLDKLKIDYVTVLMNLKVVEQKEEADAKEKTEIANTPKCLLILKREKKISRNERCEATGKKFKNCCGAL